MKIVFDQEETDNNIFPKKKFSVRNFFFIKA